MGQGGSQLYTDHSTPYLSFLLGIILEDSSCWGPLWKYTAFVPLCKPPPTTSYGPEVSRSYQQKRFMAVAVDRLSSKPFSEVAAHHWTLKFSKKVDRFLKHFKNYGRLKRTAAAARRKFKRFLGLIGYRRTPFELEFFQPRSKTNKDLDASRCDNNKQIPKL